MKNKSLCFVVSYYFPNYVRSQSLLNSLRLIKDIKIYSAVNTNFTVLRFFQTWFKTIFIKIKYNPEIYLINFRGVEIFFLLYPLIKNKVIIFDEFVSIYDSLINERKIFSSKSIPAKLIYKLEKWILGKSDLILTDTKSNKDYYARLFNLKASKFMPIYLGTDESLFKIQKNTIKSKSSNFKILFYGSLIPLHGLEIIFKAAQTLVKYPEMEFTIVGKNKNKNLDSLIKLPNIKYIPWVDYNKLPGFISQFDLCLGGPFGKTDQAKRVITGKAFQFLAMAKATVIGKNPETSIFSNKKNALLVKIGDWQELADTILWAYNNLNKLSLIGNKGQKIFLTNFSCNINKEVLEDIIKL